MFEKKFQVWLFVFMSVVLAAVLLVVVPPSSHSLAKASGEQVAASVVLTTPVPQSVNAPVQAHSVSYRYDAAGRLVSADYGDTYIIYVYDKAGNLLRQAVLNVRNVYLPLALKN